MSNAAVPTPPPPARPEPPEVDVRQMLKYYLAGEWRPLCEGILGVLSRYHDENYLGDTPGFQQRVDQFVDTLLYLLCRPDFVVPDDCIARLLGIQYAITTTVGMSSFRNSEVQQSMALGQGQNFLRSLLLSSPRNPTALDPRRVFDVSVPLASLWYASYLVAQRGLNSQRQWENVRRHLATLDERFNAPVGLVPMLYFNSTYYDCENDRKLKAHLNRQIRQQLRTVQVRNQPRRGRIAVLTEKWFPTSAVYKSLSPFVRTLAEGNELTLVTFGDRSPHLDTSLFADVRQVYARGDRFDFSAVLENDFELVYFPDIGMNPESIWLSNLRLAPVQVMGYGHPVSTFGSQIDYIIGGADVEIAAEAEKNYAERLVLIPGLGAHPVYPNYQRRDLPPRADGTVLVNCSWADVKTNYPMLLNLKAIKEKAGALVRFQFFPNWGLTRYNSALPFARDLAAVLGDDAKVMLDRPYAGYMALMEEADFSVDSHPFGGYNTIVDSLYLGKPMVTYEGRRFYNRAASALLRRLGMEELIAHNDEEYVAKAVRLASEPAWREQWVARLRAADFHATLCNTDEPQYFRKAIDYLRANHAALVAEGKRTPIVIER